MTEFDSDRFAQTRLKIGVVGLGYVGLPLALLFAEKGYEVTGIDIDETKLESIKKGESYLEDVPSERIRKAVALGNFKYTNDYLVTKNLDAVVLCVPTPLTKEGTPNLEYLEDAAKRLIPGLVKGQLIILESSTYPGTTTEFLKPILEGSGLTVGVDLFVGYSPERIDPGNQQFEFSEIPKVISGVTEKCLMYLKSFYGQVFSEVVTVSSPYVAELTKLLENSYRMINISFINEFAMLCDGLGIDAWEAIDAASTKPYGFHPFYPGPGIGGHCIPIDPIYLIWYAEQRKQADFTQFLKLGQQTNERIAYYVADEIVCLLEQSNIKPSNAKILVCGVAYKKNVRDTRETPALPIISSLKKLGAEIDIHDPLVSDFIMEGTKLPHVSLEEENLKKYHCVILLTDHSSIDIKKILAHSAIVYDTRNMTKGFIGKAKVIRLGGKGECL